MTQELEDLLVIKKKEREREKDYKFDYFFDEKRTKLMPYLCFGVVGNMVRVEKSWAVTAELGGECVGTEQLFAGEEA